MANRYLDGVDVGRKPSRAVWGVPLWITLSLTFIGVFFGWDAWIVAMFGAASFAILVAMVMSQRGGRAVRDGIELANLERMRGQLEPATERIRGLLGKRTAAHIKAILLLALGECAEAAGDFAEAADVFARGEGLLRAQRRTIVHNQLLPLFGARRAFALAACGLIEPAEAALRSTEHKDGFPQAAALASRAAILIDTKKGQFAAVRDRVVQERALHRNAFGARDRAFVRVAGALAKSKLSGASERSAVADPALREWIARALPEGQAVLS